MKMAAAVVIKKHSRLVFPRYSYCVSDHQPRYDRAAEGMRHYYTDYAALHTEVDTAVGV